MQISVCTGKALLVEVLAALRDELFRLRGAVHAAAREKTAAGEEDVVEHDADEARRILGSWQTSPATIIPPTNENNPPS